jgi:hypothetical protein
MDSIEEVGARAGKRAADLYKAREREGTDAANLQDSPSEDERAVAIYWTSYAAAFEAGIKN